MKVDQFLRYWIVLLFCLCEVSIARESDLNSFDPVVIQLFKKLNDQAVKLNHLNDSYQETGELSALDQELYAQTLIAFKNEMQEVASHGVDITDYTKNYIDVYESWAQKIISEPSLLKEITQAGSKKTSKTSDGTKVFNDGDSVRDSKIIELYQSLNDSLISIQEKFNAQVALKIDDLGDYSGSLKKEFLAFLKNEFNSFKALVAAENVAIKNQYFQFLTEKNPAFNVRNITAQDQEFLYGVNDITQNAVICQQEFMLSMTSEIIKVLTVQDLNQALMQANSDSEKSYKEQLAKNEKGLDVSWWQDLKSEGKELFGDFSVEFTKVLAQQTEEVINKQISKVAKNIGKNIVAPISAELSKQLDNLSIKLKLETVTNFLEDLSPASRFLKSTVRLNNPVELPVSSIDVATSMDLSEQEKMFMQNRLKKIQPILQKEFEISEPLSMAFCCSGGGNRAMIGTMGIFQAASKAKILQSCMYMAGLSGSTWLIAPWSYLYLQGKLNKDFEVSLQQIVQNWITVLNDANMVKAGPGMYTPACLKGQQAVNFSKQVALRLAYNEPISAVDLYGAMVGNYALDVVGDDKLKVTWSSIAKALENAEIPLPICSAVFDLNKPSPTVSKEQRKYGWYEFTPFQTGGSEIGYIPAQYLGSRFIKGQLDISPGQLCPEYPLSFVLGVCGSAFTLSLDDAVDKGLPNFDFNVGSHEVTLPIDNWVRSTLDEGTETDIRGKRINNLHARFSNFSMHVPTSVLKNEESFGLFDAGLNFNFPLPVLLDRIDRKVDLVFIYDSNPADAPAFKQAAQYYKNKKIISVPDMSKVTKKSLMSHVMTVFNDPRKKNYDEKMPTFVYFPTRAFDVLKAPYITTNFKYTQEQMENLINEMDDAFTSQLPEIKKIMQLVAKARHP